MKKENNNTNIKNQEEKVMRKEIKLEKFTDEDMIRYEWELNALYQGREHFIRDFQELYINGNCQIEKINNAISMMIDYLNDFATSARVWDNILETSKYKSFYAKKFEYGNKEMDENTKTRILNSYRPTENDTEQVVYRIYATIAVVCKKDTVMESLESPLLSSDSITRHSSQLLVTTTTLTETEEKAFMKDSLKQEAKENTNEFLSERYCNDIAGVPFTLSHNFNSKKQQQKEA